MPQPDSGDNCCGCPSRASPCDNCGGGTTGACCIQGACSILSEADCAGFSGYYFGDGTDCDPDPCADIGCCVSIGATFCSTIFPDDCTGTTAGAGSFCWPEGNITGITGACCFEREIGCSSFEVGGPFYWCCDPTIGESCCPIILSCCPAGQVCSPDDFGCIPAPVFDDPFFKNN